MASIKKGFQRRDSFVRNRWNNCEDSTTKRYIWYIQRTTSSSSFFYSLAMYWFRCRPLIILTLEISHITHAMSYRLPLHWFYYIIIYGTQDEITHSIGIGRYDKSYLICIWWSRAGWSWSSTTYITPFGNITTVDIYIYIYILYIYIERYG